MSAIELTLEQGWAWVIKTQWRGDCLIWIGATTTAGYGFVSWRLPGTPRKAQYFVHRLAWALEHQRWPADGMEIHHICKNPSCINPKHLEELPKPEHAHRTRKSGTHCRRGHEFTKYNGRNRCKICVRASHERTRLAQEQRLAALGV